jgi:hypothetical protein
MAALIGLAFGLATGLLLGTLIRPLTTYEIIVLLACALEDNWYPFVCSTSAPVAQ